MNATRTNDWTDRAAEFGHTILAQNSEGYIARDPVFPDKLARLEGCTVSDGLPVRTLPLSCADAASLRMWATTLSEAADALDVQRGMAR